MTSNADLIYLKGQTSQLKDQTITLMKETIELLREKVYLLEEQNQLLIKIILKKTGKDWTKLQNKLKEKR
jgi:hypothetical protein